jgi:hypothetical protein
LLFGERFDVGGPVFVFLFRADLVSRFALYSPTGASSYDNSLMFGGFHWNLPREINVELRYRFHY